MKMTSESKHDTDTFLDQQPMPLLENASENVPSVVKTVPLEDEHPYTAQNNRGNELLTAANDHIHRSTDPHHEISSGVRPKGNGSMRRVAGESSNQHIVHYRSRSVRSHASQGGRSTDTHGSTSSYTTRSISPFEKQCSPYTNQHITPGSHMHSPSKYRVQNLHRSGSSTSTTPTSPEVELLNGSLVPNKDGENRGKQSSAQGLSSSRSSSSMHSSQTGTSPATKNRQTIDKYGVSEKNSSSQPNSQVVSPSNSRSNTTGRTSLGNRNKPLPIPVELQEGADASKAQEVPIVSISQSDQNRDNSPSLDGAQDVPSNSNDLNGLRSAQNSLKTMFTRSNRLLRQSGANNSDGKGLLTGIGSTGRFLRSDTSLVLPSASSSPHGSVSHLSPSQVSSDRSVEGATSASPSVTSQNDLYDQETSDKQRSQSPFMFNRRRAKQDTTARQPKKSPGQYGGLFRWNDSSASSSSSQVSLHSKPTDSSAKRSNLSTRLSQHLTSFHLPTASSSFDIESKPLRPPLVRQMSRSMDAIPHISTPEAEKSLAVGTVDMVELDSIGMPAPFKTSPPTNGTPLTSSSATSAPLDRNDARKDDDESTSVAEDRTIPSESAISRLAGSLRLRTSISEKSKHRRHKSSGSLIISPKLTKALMEFTSSEETKDQEKEPDMKQSTNLVSPDDAYSSDLSHFDAAHLACALSDDGRSFDEILFGTKRVSSSNAKVEGLLVTNPHVEEGTPARDESNANELHQQNLVDLVPRTDNGTHAPPSQVTEGSKHTRRKSLGIGKVLDPLVAKSRSRSMTVDQEMALSPDRQGPRPNETSNLAVIEAPYRPHKPTKRASVSVIKGPPSSYRNMGQMGIPKSGSDSTIFTQASLNMTKRRQSLQNLASEPSPLSAAYRQSRGHTRGHSASFVMSKSHTHFEHESLPSRVSSMGTVNPLPSPTSKGRGRTMSRPNLTIDTKRSAPVPARPSSALGMRADLEYGTRTRSQNRANQPTLSIVDDKEFLQALEQVRKDNQDRIQRQREEATKIEQMARLGMATGKKRKQANGENDDMNMRKTNASPHLEGSSHPLPQRRRPVSADGRLGQNVPRTPEDDTKLSISPLSSGLSESVRSPLEAGVGKASGKLRDGAFLNDDDWKKEVKALFVIRELVLTERSYVDHLEALLSALRSFHTNQPIKRSTTPSLMMSPSNALRSQSVQPSHYAHMRNLLPQLIALSRTLANRIDENPTAAGVGAAFRLVGEQMEATFLAWSGVAKEILDALRATENGKGKSKDRIGLISVNKAGVPADAAKSHSEVRSGFASVPISPVQRSKATRSSSSTVRGDAQPYETVTPPSTTVVDSPTLISVPKDELEWSRSGSEARQKAKRRSTLSSLPPSLGTSLRTKSQGADNLASLRMSSSAAQDMGHPTASNSYKPRRRIASQSSSELDVTAGTMTESESPVNSKVSSTHVKKLTAMDIAIMPTQRLLRYLLLLRDLHGNTPPQSLSYVRLQRSLDFVQDIAIRCDHASKGNVVQVVKPTSIPRRPKDMYKSKSSSLSLPKMREAKSPNVAR